jgi:hypothetical protein
MLALLAALLLVSAVPGDAWNGGHGFGGHGFSGRGFGGVHRFHRFGGPRVFISPRVVVPFGPFWAPHWAPYGYPYAYPPVVVAPAPRVYVAPSPPVAAQPPPPTYWYYCEHPQGYYPYVQDCPGGWRLVLPTPP